MQIKVKEIKEEKEKVFHPFVLEFKIESEQDLLELIARFNIPPNIVREELLDMGLPSNIDIIDHDCKNWEYINNLYLDKPYMK